jgi:hypothetical protein
MKGMPHGLSSIQPYLMSESLPAHARNVSNWLFGWLIQALKKLNSPSALARTRASL